MKFASVPKPHRLTLVLALEGCPILSKRLHRTSSAFHRKTGIPSVKSALTVGVPSDTNRFHRTCGVSVRKTLRKFSSIRKSFRWSPSDPSDTNRFHRTCGVSVRKTLRNFHQSANRSDGVHRIHRTRIDSIGHVEFLFVRHLENCHQAARGGRNSFRWSPSDPSDTNRFYRTFGVSVRKTLIKMSSSASRGRKSFRWSPSDPSDTNRYHLTCGVSVRKTLRKKASIRKKG